MTRIILFFLFVCFALGIVQDGYYCPSATKLDEQIPGPTDPSQYRQWHQTQQTWRQSMLGKHFNATTYKIPSLQWAQTAYIQPQMMIHDRYFYNVETGRYTVDKYLDDVNTRYGGIDAVLVWQSYPNMGVDDRNQFDMILDMPGGVDGIRKMIKDFQSNNVSVLFPYNPWDNGTRYSGHPDPVSLNNLWNLLGIQGFNGDTCDTLPASFFENKTPLVLQPESGVVNVSQLEYTVMTWGYWTYPEIPAISTYKWLESRHMINVCNRWNQQKTGQIQHAFFSGVGIETWENVWGIWNGMTPRDSEATRRVASILRFTKEKEFLTSPDWQPFYDTMQPNLYASYFPRGDEGVWTIINSSPKPISGNILIAPIGRYYYDLYHGVRLEPTQVSDFHVVLHFDIEPNGYGAVLCSLSAPDFKLREFMASMAVMTKFPLSAFSSEWQVLQQEIISNGNTPVLKSRSDMVLIPGGNFNFTVSGVEIEGGDNPGVDVQFPWEKFPRRHHSFNLNVSNFYMDPYPVTNQEFLNFLIQDQYVPDDSHNFVKHWTNKTFFPPKISRQPVIWVSWEDATAYCNFNLKRLPNDWEWQYAAQGGKTDRLYPWGNSWNASNVPIPDMGRVMGPPSDVDAFPGGRSSQGIWDLVGNVYQWTNVFRDDHTRSAILRGGNHYQPQGSRWYFPQTYQLNQHSKYLLMAPSIDRSAGIGFRCVADA